MCDQINRKARRTKNVKVWFTKEEEKQAKKDQIKALAEDIDSNESEKENINEQVNNTSDKK